MRKLTISTSPSRFVSTMRRQAVSWRALTAKLSKPVRTKDTFAEYLSWDKERQNQSKDVGFYVIGAYEGDLRRNAEYQSRGVVTLDIDLPGLDFEAKLLAAFGAHAFYWHSTRKHCPERPRIRVHIPLAEDVNDAEKFQALSRLLASRYDIEAVDRVSFIPAQMMYFPSVCSDGEFRFGRHDGPWLDPDTELNSYFFDWTSRTEWPRAKAEPPPETRADKAANPLAKPGIIGAFCRAFRITDVLETHIAGTYEPAGENRWRYHSAEGAGGALVFDQDTALYSFHTGHDPVARRSTNAFDLVRIHKFGHLDKAAEEAGQDLGTMTPTELPSFRAMQEFAMSLPEVVGELTAVEAFEELPEGEAASEAPQGSRIGAAPPENRALQVDAPEAGAKPTALAPASSTGADRLAASRARLRAAVEDCDDADRLVDAVVPQVVGAALGPVEEGRMLEVVADRHQELTGRRLSLVALKQQAGELRKKMEARARAGMGEREQTALQQQMELEGVALDGDGEPVQSVDNIIKCLRAGASAGGYSVGYDTFLQTEVIREPGPSSRWRPWKDTDYTRLRLALEAIGFTTFGGGNELIRQAVALIAEQNTFDSAQAWLGELLWDQVPRVRRFAERYLGTAPGPYPEGASEYLWTELAGRVLEPGCKADMMVVFYGPQGSLKSTAVAALAPSPGMSVKIHFSEPDGDKARKIQGKLTVEIDEMRGMATSDEDAIKSFLSARGDSWIPKYRERAISAQRRCAFIGTTDKQEFLSDLAGNRRYLPLSIGRIDLAAIERDREQLWAEAAELFMRGGVSHAVERIAGDAHAAHQRGDVWDDAVREWLDLPAGVCEGFDALEAGPEARNRDGLVRIDQVLMGAIKMPLDRIKRVEEQRMAGCLQRAGMKKGFRWFNGRSNRGWVDASPKERVIKGTSEGDE